MTIGIDFEDNVRASANFNIERFDINDLDELVEFQCLAYRDQFNASDYQDKELVRRRFAWKFIDNPNRSSEKPYVWIARFKGGIIGQVCVMPTGVSVGGELYKAGWCQDLIVKDEFRDKGIGYFLIRQAISQAEGILDFLFVGGTNKNSYSLFKALGFIDICVMPRYIKVLNLHRGRKLPRIGISDDLAKPDFRLMRDRFNKGAHCIFERNKQNIEWRFIDQPYWDYKMFTSDNEGYAFARLGTAKNARFNKLNVGIVSDIFYDINNKKVFRALIRKTLTYFKDADMNLARLDILAPGLGLELFKMGFIRAPSANRFLTFCVNKDLSYMERKISSKVNWFLTYFDSDFDLS